MFKSFTGNGQNLPPKISNLNILVLFFIFLGGFGFATSYYTVQPDEQAVIIRLGRYLGTYNPGLHFKLPFGIDKKIILKTKRIHSSEFGFRSTLKRSKSMYHNSNIFGKESLMLTGDLNVADVKWVVLYQIGDPFKYAFHAKNPIRNIRDASESIMRRVVGDRLVSDVLTTGRTEISLTAKKLMQEVLDKYDIGILIKAVKLQDVNPPDIVKPSFNEVNEAKQEQEKVINQAEKEYNKVIPEARGKAEEEIAKAEGYALSLINKAKGDSKRFTSFYQSFKKAPSVTKKRLLLETMEEVFNNLDSVKLIDHDLKGFLPIVHGKTNFSSTK